MFAARPLETVSNVGITP